MTRTDSPSFKALVVLCREHKRRGERVQQLEDAMDEVLRIANGKYTLLHTREMLREIVRGVTR
jgi:hypothetical protein